MRQTLAAALGDGRLPHAILLEGDEGTGRKTLALLLAQALVCTSGQKPCGVCTPCKKAAGGIHPDITVVEAKGKAGMITVDVVRAVREWFYVRPNEAGYKICILPDAGRMNAHAQNALLKILEEPPAYGVFVLTVLSASQLLETVLSRVSSFTLLPPSRAECVGVLRTLLPQADPARIDYAAGVFDGNIGKALRLVQDEAFGRQIAFSLDFCRAIVSPNEYDLLALTGKIEKDRELMKLFLPIAVNILRDVVSLKTGAGVYVTAEETQLREIAERLRLDQALQAVEILGRAQAALQSNANGPLLATWLCASLKRAACS
ncbi:MAG: ATP-binding protein [Oscillospiraceae bacterium]